MAAQSRFVAINGRELRQQRLARGWTQLMLAKKAGYSERLVRKAELGGTLDVATIQNLAEALSTPNDIVPAESLTLDIAAIARKWVETFDTFKIDMLSEMAPFFSEDFVFECPGDPQMAPFVGIWVGVVGLQQWLNQFFGFFDKNLNVEVEYAVGEETVIARWLAICTYQGVECPPVRINMTFRFKDGMISRIVDDYDTHTGVVEISRAKTLVDGNDS